MKPINGRELRTQLRLPTKAAIVKKKGFDTTSWYEGVFVHAMRAEIQAVSRLSLGVFLVRKFTPGSEEKPR